MIMTKVMKSSYIFALYLLIQLVRATAGETTDGSSTAWTGPSFTLSIGPVHDSDHPEAAVPDVCDAAKRPVTFHYSPSRQAHCFDPNRRMDMVIAHSVEFLHDLEMTIATLRAVPNFQHLDPCVLVGSKVMNASDILAVQGVDTVFELANAGREWPAYFTYIIAYYDNLPEHVLFMHARFNPRPEEYVPKVAMFGPSTGVMGIGAHGTCTCHGCTLPAPSIRFRELWSIFRRSFCPQIYVAFFNGHYIVSRKRIRDNSVDLYKLLYRYVMPHPRHFLSGDANEQMSEDPKFYIDLIKNQAACQDTFGGHVMERAWAFVFNCWNEGRRDVCQSYNGTAVNPTCAYNGFQCYDSIPPYHPNTTSLGGEGMSHTRRRLIDYLMVAAGATVGL